MRPAPGPPATSRKLSSDDAVVFTVSRRSSSGKRRADPRRAVALLLVDDDRQPRDARGDEVPDRRLDQRHAGDRHHGLGHGPAGLPQAAALARGDDAAQEARLPREGRLQCHGSSPSRSRSDRITRSPGQHGRPWRAGSGVSQMCAMPAARAPAMSRASESPTMTARPGSIPSASTAVHENARVRLAESRPAPSLR